MVSSKSSTTRCPVRSISLSCRLNPTSTRIEQELNELKTWEASHLPSEKSISYGLIGLAKLYVCLDDLLNLSSTREAISHNRKGEWVGGLLDGSVRVLDICGKVRDVVSQVRENIINLQCVLRRRKGDSSTENSVASYMAFRKKIKKDVKRLVGELKQVKSINARLLGLNHDRQITPVIRVIMEVNEMIVSVLESTLLYFNTLGLKTKLTKWSLVSKLMQKGVVACEDQKGNVNDMENVDIALVNLCKNGSSIEGEKLQTAQMRLKTCEAHVESIDKGLESMFRHLIRTRAY